MAGATDRHEAKLLAILRAVAAPVSLTDLTNISGLQKTTVSSVLNNAAFWGKVTIRQDGIDSQTFFEITSPTPSENIRSAKARWVFWYPPTDEPYCQLVGQFKLLNYLHDRG